MLRATQGWKVLLGAASMTLGYQLLSKVIRASHIVPAAVYKIHQKHGTVLTSFFISNIVSKLIPSLV
jgi:hypothetical protein